MDNIKIEYLPISDLKPYERNQRKHADYDVSQIMVSIQKYGFLDPIGVWSDKNIIVEGHGRLAAAKKLHMKEVPVIRLDHLTDEQRKEYAIIHNKTAELSEWDFDLLAEDVPTLDFSEFDIDWGLSDESKEELEKKYTEKTDIPQYEPTDKEWELNDLYDDEKKQQLIDEINQADIEVEVKEFLKMAAYRHVKFNYKKIADYYAKANKEIQELMEKSALVIIDYEDAIKNGYSMLNSMAGEYAYD